MQIDCTCCIVATIQYYNTCSSCSPSSRSGHITGGGGFTLTSARQSGDYFKQFVEKNSINVRSLAHEFLFFDECKFRYKIKQRLWRLFRFQIWINIFLDLSLLKTVVFHYFCIICILWWVSKRRDATRSPWKSKILCSIRIFVC